MGLLVTILFILIVVLWSKIHYLNLKVDKLEKDIKGKTDNHPDSQLQINKNSIIKNSMEKNEPTQKEVVLVKPEEEKEFIKASIKSPEITDKKSEQVKTPNTVNDVYHEPKRTFHEEKKPVIEVKDPNSVIEVIKSWLFSGNIPARLGVVLSLLGFIAMVKYGHTHGYFKITPAIGVTVLAAASIFTSWFGWRKRLENRTFGMALQGGGIAALTFVIFSSYRMYELLPSSLALILTGVVTITATLMAIKQNSKWLVGLGFLGGYLAPLVLSSGTGNHVPLFTLYAILNTAVAIIAYKKDWPGLNSLGFLFTFVIGFSWANKYYKPELISTVEPFIVIFFLTYILIAVFDKLPVDFKDSVDRPPSKIKKAVSGMIVFGTPLILAPTQMYILNNNVTSNTIVCLLLSVIYFMLYRLKTDTNKTLGKSFLILSFIFASLSIPMMFDGEVVMSMLAAEGAAVIWLAGRNITGGLSRNFSIVSGSVLQFIAFLMMGTSISGNNDAGASIIFNSEFINKIILFTSLITSSYVIYKTFNIDDNGEELKVKNNIWAIYFLPGLFVFLEAIMSDVPLIPNSKTNPWHLEFLYMSSAIVLLTTASSLMMKKFNDGWAGWRIGVNMSVLLLPIVVFLALKSGGSHSIFDMATTAGFALMIISSIYISRINIKINKNENWVTVYPLIISITVAISAQLYVMFGDIKGIDMAVMSIPWAALAALLTLKPEYIFKWFGYQQDDSNSINIVNIKETETEGDDQPVNNFLTGMSEKIIGKFSLYREHDKLLLFTCLISAIFCVLMVVESGKITPYLPILNPTDFMTIFIFIICLTISLSRSTDNFKDGYKAWFYIFGIMALCGIAVRVVHNMLGVPWHGIINTAQAQSSITLVMATVSVSTLLYGSKCGMMKAWYGGATLMGIVVCKLILIDSSHMSGVSGIVSFMATGGLLLFVGYFAPKPPGAAV